MLPICFTAKERLAPSANEEPDVGLKDMFLYLKTNKYLLIANICFMIVGVTNVSSAWGMYIAR